MLSAILGLGVLQTLTAAATPIALAWQAPEGCPERPEVWAALAKRLATNLRRKRRSARRARW